MLSVIAGYLPDPRQANMLEKIVQAKVMLGNFAVSVVTEVTNYLLPPSDHDDYYSNNATEYSDGCCFYHLAQFDDDDHDQPSLCFLEDSGPMSLPYLGAAARSFLGIDDSFPCECDITRSAQVSVDPKSLHCFETASMIYIPGQFETLDVKEVNISQGSELAQKLGVSGKVPVDKVVYEPGTGAIIAQVILMEKAFSFTLFYIETESHISFTETQVLDNKRFVPRPDQNVNLIHEIYRKRLKRRYSRRMNRTEYHQLLSKFTKKKKRAKPSIEVIKWYRCHSDVSGVTNGRGHDITEAIKNRMYQEEERLASNPIAAEYDDINAQFKAVEERKKDWLATQRSATRLCIAFESLR